MSLYQYATQYDPLKTGRAQAYDLNASYKDLTQVCHAIRRKPIAVAVKTLEDALSFAKPIRYRQHSTGAGHRSQLGGRKGRFPQRECKLALELLANAFANAQARGLKEDAIYVLHAQAYKQNVFPRYRRFFASSNTLGYGKQAIWSNYSTARLELVVGERGLKPSKRKTEAMLKLEEKARKLAKAKEAKEKAKAGEPKAADGKQVKEIQAVSQKKQDGLKEPKPAESAAKEPTTQKPAEKPAQGRQVEKAGHEKKEGRESAAAKA